MASICHGRTSVKPGVAPLSALLIAAAGLAWGEEPGKGRAAATLPDLSGLAWLEGDTFLAVHDAKNPDEMDRPRASVVVLPNSPEGITWRPIEVAWPGPQGPSSDLESLARIPGTSSLLLVESGEGEADGKPFRRIFVAEYDQGELTLTSFTDWPVEVKNVEGTAIAKIGDRLVFVFAERDQGQPSTNIRWAEFQQDPLTFGPFQSVAFQPPDDAGELNRPLVGLDVDEAGRIYAVSAFDPGDDNGPFRSVVWRIGQFETSTGDAQIRLTQVPERLAVLDGLKVECVTVREESGTDEVQVFVGTDDENYGATLRMLPPT